MSELPLKEAIKILTQEKKKVELKLAKAYDSFCLYPNERDQNDWDRFSALDSAFEMAISALMKQIPMKTLPYEMGLDGKIEIPCGNCGSSLDGIWDYCPYCGQNILWRVKDDSTRSKTTA